MGYLLLIINPGAAKKLPVTLKKISSASPIGHAANTQTPE
jgi:hypothetical protein